MKSQPINLETKKRKISRFRWRWYRRFTYLKLFFFNFFEFDQSYLLKMIETKLTLMGLQFALFGVSVPKYNKKKIRSIWLTRYYLKKYYNSEDEMYELTQKYFFDKYGFNHDSEPVFTKTQDDDKEYASLTFKLKIPETYTGTDTEEDMDKYYFDRLKYTFKKNNLGKKYLNLVFYHMKKNLESWWD